MTDRCILLTGATGTVGSALAPLLAARPGTRLRLLIRARDDAELAGRLERLCAWWGWEEGRPERRRVSALRGDAAAPAFGLERADFARLGAATTHIVHCAASVRMNLPLEEARRSAVGSARAILDLAGAAAAAGRLAKVEFVSTVGVGGRSRRPVAETWADPAGPFHNTYEQSKAEAEALVRTAGERDGLPITVHRPSMVVGAEADGRIIHHQIFYHICALLAGPPTAGWFVPLGRAGLDIIPVNRVAEAIAASLDDRGTAGLILNLCAGPERELPLTLLRERVRRLFAADGIPLPALRTLPRPLFALAMRAAARFGPTAHRRALGTMPIYLDYLAEPHVFDNARYARWLAARGQGLHAPAELIETVVGAWLRAGGPGSRNRSAQRRVSTTSPAPGRAW